MAYDGSPIIRDENNDPVPQIWNGTEWVAYEGQAFDLENLVATETTLDTRLNSLEGKMDTLLNSQDTDNNLSVKQSGSIDVLQDKEIIQTNLSLETLLMITPGKSSYLPNTLDDNTGSTWFGEVTSDELISGDSLADLVDLTAGETIFDGSSHSEEGWLKYLYKDKICYMAKKPFRHSIHWNNLGRQSGGILGENEIVMGSNIIEINGIKYRIRIPEGGTADNEGNRWGFIEGEYGVNEWNVVMFNLCQCDINGHIGSFSWTDGDHNLYTNAELGIGGDVDPEGSATWCQEPKGDIISHRVRRGLGSLVSYATFDAGIPATAHSWRPVLEVVK